MTVDYLVPTLNRPSLSDVRADFHAFNRGADTLVTCVDAGMTAALRHAFELSEGEIVRNCADDDRYPPEASRRAAEVMEADPSLDVLVTGGVKTYRRPVCVPKGAGYGASVRSVAEYGACGSGLWMRREAVKKYGLLDYNGHLIDNFIVLKAIAGGAKVRFCRLNTYVHKISVANDRAVYEEFIAEKKRMRVDFGIWGVKRLPYERPAVWDGAFA